MVRNGEHCLHLLMIEVRMVCNGEHCLHWLKLVCLWIYVHLYFENIFPLQKSCLWSLLDGKMELKTWETCVPIKKNVCCGIPYGHRSARVLHLLRGGVTGVMCWYGSNFNFLCHKALPGCHSLGKREDKMGSLINQRTGQIPTYKPKRSRVQRFHPKMDWEPTP